MKIINHSVNGKWVNKKNLNLHTKQHWLSTARSLGFDESGVKAVAWTTKTELHSVRYTQRSLHHYWGPVHGTGNLPNHERIDLTA